MVTYGINSDANILAAESTRHSWDLEQNREARAHDITVRKLELELLKEQNIANRELAALEAKWNTWLKIPILVLKLPIYILLGLSYPLFVLTKTKPDANYWKFLR